MVGRGKESGERGVYEDLRERWLYCKKQNSTHTSLKKWLGLGFRRISQNPRAGVLWALRKEEGVGKESGKTTVWLLCSWNHMAFSTSQPRAAFLVWVQIQSDSSSVFPSFQWDAVIAKGSVSNCQGRMSGLTVVRCLLWPTSHCQGLGSHCTNLTAGAHPCDSVQVEGRNGLIATKRYLLKSGWRTEEGISICCLEFFGCKQQKPSGNLREGEKELIERIRGGS